MYEELVQRLRADADYMDNNGIMLYAAAPFYRECADAIEELQEDNAALNGTASNLIEQIAELSKPRWVSVTERLPDESGNYLTAFGEGKAMAVNEFMHPRDWLTEEGSEADPNGKWYWGGVTHWMPLPDPPKREDNG